MVFCWFPILKFLILFLFRDIRLVNWDCVLRTAISDIEVIQRYYGSSFLMYIDKVVFVILHKVFDTVR